MSSNVEMERLTLYFLLVDGGKEEEESLEPTVLGTKVLQLEVGDNEVVEFLKE